MIANSATCLSAVFRPCQDNRRKVSIFWRRVSARLFDTIFILFLTTVTVANVSGQEREEQVRPDSEKRAEQTKEGEVEQIECSARLQTEIGLDNKPYFIAPISLEPLEAGKKYQLNITLVNPTNEAISYSKIRVDCACAKFEASVDEIPPLGKSNFTMHLTAQNSISDRGFVTSAKYVGRETGQVIIRMDISYQLKGVFGFLGERHSIEIQPSEQFSVSKIPVVIMPPLSIEQLKLNVSENLRDVNAKLIGDPDNSSLAYVEISAPREVVARGTVMGDLELQRSGTDFRSRTVVSLQQQQRITVSPESIRLVRDNSTKPFKATATLRIGKPLKTTGVADVEPAEKQLKQVPRVELSVGDTAAKLRLRQMGSSGIYRIEIEYDGAVELDESGKMDAKWGISVDGEERVVPTHAFFPTLGHERKGDD
jgi:hypothetical protein